MAYDEKLAGRLRALLSAEAGLTERAMFGGLGFMVGGNMCCGAMKDGDLMVRVDPEDGVRLAEGSPARPMEQGGRTMTGWLLVPPDAVADDADLGEWVRRGVAYARTLPPK